MARSQLEPIALKPCAHARPASEQIMDAKQPNITTSPKLRATIRAGDQLPQHVDDPYLLKETRLVRGSGRAPRFPGDKASAIWPEFRAGDRLPQQLAAGPGWRRGLRWFVVKDTNLVFRTSWR